MKVKTYTYIFILYYLIFILFYSFIFPKASNAIIFFAPIFLIPIAKILGVILAALGLPLAAIGTAWVKLFKSDPKKMIFTLTTILIIILSITGIVLRVLHPDRPLF